jgi:glycosyltransferase involved in cell wall biosynthesis
MKKPLLSVIIPVYNTADSVERIVGRVLRQKMRNFELILIDDGSTDGTPQILKNISKPSKRVRIITQKNAGPSAARNTGLNVAKGEFVLFLDSDDDINPQMIPRMVQKQQSADADLVTCAIKEIYPNGTTYTPNIQSRLIDSAKQNVVVFALDSMGKESSVIYNPSNRIMRRNIITKNHLQYRSDLRFGEDLAFNLEYLRHAHKIAVMSQPFYIYYQNSSTSVFSESVLDYSYRQKNASFLWEFAGLSDDPTVYNLAVWVQTRWFLSFCKFIRKSSLSGHEKRRRIVDACSHERFKKLNKIKVLPFSRKIIIKATLLLTKHPYIFYFSISIASRFSRQ